jgi:hypothetical protein
MTVYREGKKKKNPSRALFDSGESIPLFPIFPVSHPMFVTNLTARESRPETSIVHEKEKLNERKRSSP